MSARVNSGLAPLSSANTKIHRDFQMKSITFSPRITFVLAMVAVASTVSAQQVGQIDDFEDATTQGWKEGPTSPNKPTNISSGGPDGANDNYLRNVSSGTFGAGGRMVLRNTTTWSGDYNNAEIESIQMWLLNEGDTPMQIRIALGDAGGNIGTWFASSNAFALPADDVWRQASFDLSSTSLTRIQGTSSRAAVLSSVAELRILSAAQPDFRGDIISATLGVDDIEALGAEPLLPQEFKDLVSMQDFNGNNSTDVGVFRFNPNTAKNTITVMDGSTGNQIGSVNYGSAVVRDSSTVSDANGDMIPEFGALVEGSLLATVKDVVNNTTIGKPKFNDDYDTVAILSVGNVGGGAGPDVAVVGRLPSTGKVQAWVKDVASGNLVNRMTFDKAFVPFAAVAVDNVGDTNAMEIAVLGIDANDNVQAQIKDAKSGNLINKIQFDKNFTPLFFAAVPNTSGKLKQLAVLGRNAAGKIRAQIKRVSNGTLVAKVQFDKNFEPRAFISFVDSNGSGGGEIAVVGVNANDKVRAQAKEISDGSLVKLIDFSSKYPPQDAIAINGAAGTGRNEIAVYGQKANGEDRVQIKDLLTGDLVNNIPLP